MSLSPSCLIDSICIILPPLLFSCQENEDAVYIYFFVLQLSPLKGPHCLGLLKSQSLCVLPGPGGGWRGADTPSKGETLNRRLTTSNCSLREAVTTSYNSAGTAGAGVQNGSVTSEKGLNDTCWNGFGAEVVLKMLTSVIVDGFWVCTISKATEEKFVSILLWIHTKTLVLGLGLSAMTKDWLFEDEARGQRMCW